MNFHVNPLELSLFGGFKCGRVGCLSHCISKEVVSTVITLLAISVLSLGAANLAGSLNIMSRGGAICATVIGGVGAFLSPCFLICSDLCVTILKSHIFPSEVPFQGGVWRITEKTSFSVEKDGVDQVRFLVQGIEYKKDGSVTKENKVFVVSTKYEESGLCYSGCTKHGRHKFYVNGELGASRFRARSAAIYCLEQEARLNS